MRRRFPLPVLGAVFFLFLLTGMGKGGTVRIPESVKKALLKKGVSQEVLKASFSGAFNKVEIGIILKNVTHKEVMADYRRFLQEKTLRMTKKYLSVYNDTFVEVEKAYRVPKEVVASILMVESSFGKNGGNTPVLTVYASLASLADKDVRKKVWKEAAKAGENVQAKRFKRRIDRKARWGLKELLCLLRLKERRRVDLYSLRGSWAGAFGMPQFIPTSFEAYGVDWDGDGRVDLDTFSDAVASTANYLHRHGWKNSLTRKKALRVIKFYNLSNPYATTILKMSKKLEEMR